MSYIISALLFYLVILPISWLPFPLLYGLSDLLFFIFYYIFPYRRKVILQNLISTFPEKSEREIKAIEKKFYKHFCDLFLETLKLFSASQQTIESRIQLVNADLLDDYYRNGKSLVLVTGHYATGSGLQLHLLLIVNTEVQESIRNYQVNFLIKNYVRQGQDSVWH